MREILFRGRDSKGNWYYGFPMIYNKEYATINRPMEHDELVEIETIGQYTYLKDKNGKKIFDGDIIKECIGKTIEGKPRYIYYCINWSDDERCYKAFKNGLKGYAYTIDFAKYVVDEKQLEVVGNFWDNPELLGGAKCQNE